jgi:hypothetical protein
MELWMDEDIALSFRRFVGHPRAHRQPVSLSRAQQVAHT